MLKKINPLMKRKMLNVLFLVLLGYAFYFLYLLVKLSIELYNRRAHLEFNLSIVTELIVEIAMIALSGYFAFIIFRIRKDAKKNKK